MLSAEKIARVRNFSFGATGLIGLLYAVLVVFTKRPDPMPWWLPGTVGLLSAALIFSTFPAARAQSWYSRPQTSCSNAAVIKPTGLGFGVPCCCIRFSVF